MSFKGKNHRKKEEGAVTLPVFLLITLIVTELALAGLVTANALNNTLFGERLAIEASQAARAGAQDAIMKVIRNCPFSVCPTYFFLVGPRSRADISFSRDIVSGNITITSTGSSFTRKKKMEAILGVDQTTGKVQIQSLKEVAF